MKRAKRATIYVAAGLLVAAAAAKLLFPARTSETIRTIERSVQRADYAAGETVSAVKETTGEPVTVTINAAEYLGLTEPVSTEEELPPAVTEAMAAFMEEQQPFVDLGIPANVAYDAPMPSFSYVRPLTARVSSEFGYRVHPLENLTKFHYGMDLAANSGDDIVCFAAGTVTEVGENSTSGKFVRVEHEDGYATMYAHCGQIYVEEGQKVSTGEKIALVGATGRVTGPHLHFELTHDGTYLNPAFYLAAL